MRRKSLSLIVFLSIYASGFVVAQTPVPAVVTTAPATAVKAP